MTEGDEQQRAVLHGYAKFLPERESALPKHQPHLVRWVREFLHFARAHRGYTFEQTLDLFLAEIGVPPACFSSTRLYLRFGQLDKPVDVVGAV